MRYLYILSLFIISSCKPKEIVLSAQQIIDKTIVVSGADKIKNSKITFKFRNKKYKAERKKGSFKLMRSFDSIVDILNNDGFKRLINNKEIILKNDRTQSYKNSVNSVHYFSVLPFGLNNSAVRKKLLLPSTINKKEYYKVEITFSENGGGEDFEDVFIYWIGKEDFFIDYLAYSYHINGGGKRFRVLKEQCNKNGIRFVDYYNYSILDDTIELSNLDNAFEMNKLKKVSEIILEDIEVKLLD